MENIAYHKWKGLCMVQEYIGKRALITLLNGEWLTVNRNCIKDLNKDEVYHELQIMFNNKLNFTKKHDIYNKQ